MKRILPLVLCILVSTCWAQAVGVSAKPLMRTGLSGDESKETVMLAIEFAPGDGPARTVATFVGDKGKPLTAPAP